MSTDKPLPTRQQDVLDLYCARYPKVPTFREIGDALGIASTNGVADHVDALIRKGYLTRGPPGEARSIQLTSKARRPAVRKARVQAIEVIREDGSSELMSIDRKLLPTGNLKGYRVGEGEIFFVREGLAEKGVVLWEGTHIEAHQMGLVSLSDALADSGAVYRVPISYTKCNNYGRVLGGIVAQWQVF